MLKRQKKKKKKKKKKKQKKIAKVFEYKQIACTRGRAAPNP
jgi:hypothetical protein